MINIIRKEPVIKKSIFIMMMSIIVIFSIFTVFQYNNLKNIYLEQENINKRVVGILVNKYPQQEVDIVKSIYKQYNRYLDLNFPLSILIIFLHFYLEVSLLYL